MQSNYLKIAVSFIFGVILMFLFFKGNSTNNSSSLSKSGDSIVSKSAESVSKKYSVTLKTSRGDIVIELNSDQTPKTVENFVSLAKKGFYNNTIFHRAVEGFMIQGGDQKGDGTGGPGYKFNDEPFTGDYTRGTVAMANSGKNTNGSQFFIMHKDYSLAKNYVIFGRVVSGMEVVDAIATDKVVPNAYGENSKPVNPTMILSAEVKEL